MVGVRRGGGPRPTYEVAKPARNGNNDAVELSMPFGVFSGATQAAFEIVPFHQMRIDVARREPKQLSPHFITTPQKMKRVSPVYCIPRPCGSPHSSQALNGEFAVHPSQMKKKQIWRNRWWMVATVEPWLPDKRDPGDKRLTVRQRELDIPALSQNRTAQVNFSLGVA
jgi:hypothetical protein